MRRYKRGQVTISRRQWREATRDEMKNASLESVLVFGLILAAPVLGQEKKYTTRYDNVDVDAIIGNERLLNRYVGCLLERNSCTPDGAELKKNIPDALATDCASCSEAQKTMADKFAHHLIDEKPAEWRLLEEKYDPTGDYRERYLEDKRREDKPESE